MKENKNQEVLQDAIMKALDDAELEGVDGGISKRTIAEIAGGIALASAISWTVLEKLEANDQRAYRRDAEKEASKYKEMLDAALRDDPTKREDLEFKYNMKNALKNSNLNVDDTSRAAKTLGIKLDD